MQEPKYRSWQIINWIHNKGELDIDKMSNLSKQLRENSNRNIITAYRMRACEQRQTIKWLLKLQCGNVIETVMTEDNRKTLCISSQVGCPLDCDFVPLENKDLTGISLQTKS